MRRLKPRFGQVGGAFLFVALLPLLIVVKLLIWPFERPLKRTRSEVVAILRAFLEGTATDSDWDDFVCVPIADSTLEGIRRRCADLPEEFPSDGTGAYCSRAGEVVLRDFIRLLEEGSA